MYITVIVGYRRIPRYLKVLGHSAEPNFQHERLRRHIHSPTLDSKIFMRYSRLITTAVLSIASLTAILTAKPDRLTAQTHSIGWEVEGSSQINRIALSEIEYFGECPGVAKDVKTARFVSTKTPPNRHQRVVVRNLTPGLAGDPSPYTDRKYNQGRTSESTQIELGGNHSSQRFRVTPGENKFEYEIRQRGQVIDSGRFTAVIDRLTEQRRRDATWYEDQVCGNSAVDLKVCADRRVRKQYRCENGNVLETQINWNDDRVLTTISNQTERNITAKIDGELYPIEAGDSIRLRRRLYGGADQLSVRFNAGPNTTWQTTNVTIGKQLKIQNKFGGGIELVDYPHPGSK
jgi:hypothetical protein